MPPMNTPQIIPIFPLPMVLFPTEQLPLHIFEPKYKDMIHHCLTTQSPFGMVLTYNNGITQTGCSAIIVRKIKEYEDGKRDILVRGQERFQINKIQQEFAYFTADVTWLVDKEATIPQSLKLRFLALYTKWMEALHQKQHLLLNPEEDRLSFVVGRNLPLKPEQKQILLQIGSEVERLSFLSDYLTKYIPEASEMAETKRLIQSDGHFENIFPDLDHNQDNLD